MRVILLCNNPVRRLLCEKLVRQSEMLFNQKQIVLLTDRSGQLIQRISLHDYLYVSSGLRMRVEDGTHSSFLSSVDIKQLRSCNFSITLNVRDQSFFFSLSIESISLNTSVGFCVALMKLSTESISLSTDASSHLASSLCIST